MSYRTESLNICPLFTCENHDPTYHQNYRAIIFRTLKAILPADFFEGEESTDQLLRHQQHYLQRLIPLVTYSKNGDIPARFSFCSLSKLRQNSFKFFFEMVSQWLTPGRRLNVVFVYATDFRLPDLSDDIYTICEVMVHVADQSDCLDIQRNFPAIQSELILGMHSEFYAQRILEIKGLSSDDKITLVHAFIASLVKRFPQHFDTDIYSEMRHVLVTCRDDFKRSRLTRHLSRIICIKYLLRRRLKEALKDHPQRRHIKLKVFRALIQSGSERKQILGVFIGFNLLRDQENFGEKHLLRAIQHFIPSAIPIENTYYYHRVDSVSKSFSYLEIEKRDGSTFSSAEIRKLRRELPENIKNRIEHRLHKVFMPRNEEEVMRNMLTLTNQMKYVRDVPQVFINFDEQAYAHLYFTVIVARLLKSDMPSVADLFKQSSYGIEYIHDRTKIMGYVRKKYPKEATVFRLKLLKEGFLRSDQSIDLYKARQTIVHELSRVMGDIRDYNGGMISKQHDLLVNVRKVLSDTREYDELLLENFFYSLAPVVASALTDPEAFKTLFLMLIEGINEANEENYYLKFHTVANTVFALIIIEDISVKDRIHQAIQEIHIPSAELASAHVKNQGNVCLGYICSARDQKKREQFFQAISQTLYTHTTSKANSASRT